MKKMIIVGMSILCSVCSIGPAFCEPDTVAESSLLETDAYGNPIDWSEGAADGECPEDETYAVEGLEVPTMSSSEAAEAESIVASMQETAETYGTTKGTVQIKCDMPDNFPGYTIEMLIYDDNFKKTTVDCYQKNGYVSKVELPEGHYMIGDVYVPNDKQNRYPMIPDCKDFTISGSDQKVISVALAQNYTVPASTTEATDEGRIPVSVQEKRSTSITLCILGAVAGLTVLLFIGAKKLINKNRFE